MRSTEEKTHFGFRSIPKGEKEDRVRDVFVGVSSRYDLMNDLMSGGMHRVWKTAMVDWLAPRQDQRILDLAGGTGDIAFRILERQPLASLTVLDLTEEMLARGRERSARSRVGSDISWIAGGADALPFAEGSFDACTVAFGIRNFPDIAAALAEMHRVLRIGGRVLILEFGHVEIGGLSELYDRYSFGVIPGMGGLVLNDRDSYRYLVESIRRFPRSGEFSEMIAGAGFGNVAVRNMAFGIASIHSGWKI